MSDAARDRIVCLIAGALLAWMISGACNAIYGALERTYHQDLKACAQYARSGENTTPLPLEELDEIEEFCK